MNKYTTQQLKTALRTLYTMDRPDAYAMVFDELHSRMGDEAFDAFCTRDDLPEFDYIGLHGIWSWVSAETRLQMTAAIRRYLAPGGVLAMQMPDNLDEPSHRAMREVSVEQPLGVDLSTRAETLSARARAVLLDRGVTVVATSNRKPTDLYTNGINDHKMVFGKFGGRCAGGF